MTEEEVRNIGERIVADLRVLCDARTNFNSDDDEALNAFYDVVSDIMTIIGA